MLGVCGSHPDHGLNNEICQASHLHILDNTCAVMPYRLRSFLATIERRGLSVAVLGRVIVVADAGFGGPRLRKIEQLLGLAGFLIQK